MFMVRYGSTISKKKEKTIQMQRRLRKLSKYLSSVEKKTRDIHREKKRDVKK